MRKAATLTVTALAGVVTLTGPVGASPFFFSTGNPNGLIGTATRPTAGGKIEIETGDDFILGQRTSLETATLQGLVPTGTTGADIRSVIIEIYRIFPKDSNDPPSGRVPTRVNSPSDVAFADRESSDGSLSFTSSFQGGFSVANSVVNGINPIPNQTTGGEGPVSGERVLLEISFDQPFDLPADHYFFIPQIELASGDFLWLSAPKPIVAPGTPIDPDLQSWIRDENLQPDWLRVGTDIIGGEVPPTFNATFSVSGETRVPEPGTVALIAAGLASMELIRRRSRL
jgi:hypothetical protein